MVWRRSFWGCSRFPDGCRWTINVNDEGVPVRTNPHEAEDVADRILEVKDSLIVLLWRQRRQLGRRRTYVLIGATLDTEDLVELGELKREILEMKR